MLSGQTVVQQLGDVAIADALGLAELSVRSRLSRGCIFEAGHVHQYRGPMNSSCRW
jgi:hypothetical protein